MASIYKRGGKKNRHGRYRISYFDEFGRRQDVTAGTSDYDAAQQVAGKLEADASLKRRGVITPQEGKLAELNAKPVAEHVSEYLAHCRRQKQDGIHVGNKDTQLKKLLGSTGARVLSELSREAVQRHLDALTDAGKSARTVNQHRTTIATFIGWCYAAVGIYQNPLAKMPRMDEAADQRRVRRALTDEELAKLMAVPQAVAAGRADYYTVITLAGLRSGDAKQITWADVDIEAGILRIRQEVSKSRREDFIPLHPQVLDVLKRMRAPFAKQTDRVFRAIPKVTTFHKDCKRAGIERYDAEGRQLDLHALGRTTFGTRLANSGIMPQMAAKLMRHSDVKITMKHYTKLRMHDEQRAVAALPQIAAAQVQAAQATGTHSVYVTLQQNRQQSCGIPGHPMSLSDVRAKPDERANMEALPCDFSGKNNGLGASGHSMAPSDLMIGPGAANMQNGRAIGAVG